MSTAENAWTPIVSFLEQYNWIFDFQNNDFFIKKVWTRIPDKWVHFLSRCSMSELNQLPVSLPQNSAIPEDFKLFLTTISSLVINRTCSEDAIALDVSETKGMKLKKQHEVAHLSGYVYRECKRNNCAHVLDVGSGLGYVGKVLSSRFNFHVVGLEKDTDRVESAQKSHKKTQCSPLLESKTFTMNKNDECSRAFNELLDEISRFPVISEAKTCDRLETADPTSDREAADLSGDRICMIGLHCCADLTPLMLRYFVRYDRLKSLVCFGCCYHKLSQTGDAWCEFPISESLKQILDGRKAMSLLPLPAMRLAAQETKTRWQSMSEEEHAMHSKHVAYRGILEVFAKSEKVSLQKSKRRIAAASDFASFDTYIDACLRCFTFPGLKPEYIRSKMKSLHKQNEPYFQYIEIFTCLQVMMQPVLESLIINDRVAFLKEHGLAAKSVAIFSENISPRNIAIVASKN